MHNFFLKNVDQHKRVTSFQGPSLVFFILLTRKLSDEQPSKNFRDEGFEKSKFYLYFSDSCIPINPKLSYIKPVTDEQVFYDKFLCDKFYLPSARVHMQQILFTGVNVFTLTIYQPAM